MEKPVALAQDNIEQINEHNANANAQVNNHSQDSKSEPVDQQKAEESKKGKPAPEHIHFHEHAAFAWTNVGEWEIALTKDKKLLLKELKRVQAYVLDHLYGDWWWNCSLMIGTCFYLWFLARWGFGILSLLLVGVFTTSVYRAEFRRFNRNIRDDMKRVKVRQRLESNLELMEWLNLFLAKFWIIYMPAFSEMVMYQANQVLEGQAPGFGIDKLTLEEFTLGLKAPRINSVRTYPLKAHDHVEMEWDFSFSPSDTSDMTKREIQKRVPPKVELGVTVGKAFVSKTLPILVEDMLMTGTLNVKLKLMDNFPHVKMVSIQFLEAPKIDYEFKPMGGDTFGIDIMSLIPGLSSFVNGIIHSNLRPVLYAPNSLDIDIEDFIDENLGDLIGVLAVTVTRCTDLKRGPNTEANSLNPYVQLKVANNGEIDFRTKAKEATNDPVFLETKYVLLNQLENNQLNLNVFDVEKAKADDTLLGSTTFQLSELLQKNQFEGVTKTISEAGKTTGKVIFDLKWFPILPPFVHDDGTKERPLDLEVGILKLSLHEATNLDLTPSQTGLVLPWAQIYVNGELARSCRRLAQTNEPSWEELFETLITKQSDCLVLVVIYDQISGQIISRLELNLQDIVFETGRGQQWHECPPLYEDGVKPRIKITASWKPLAIDSQVWKTFYLAPIGGVRIHLREARGLVNLESVGYVDPYCKIMLGGQERGRTAIIADTTEPNWNKAIYLPVSNPHSHFLLEIMDAEPEGKDRPLGNAAVNVFDFLKKDSEGRWMGYDGAENEILEQPVLLSGQQQGVVYYSVLFVPCIPMYSSDEAANIDIIRAQEEQKLIEDQKRREQEIAQKTAAPKEWIWVETEDDSNVSPQKVTMSLEQVIKYRAGAISVEVLSGRFEKPDLYLQILFDEHASPLGVTPKAEGKILLTPLISEAFIRDLPNSNIIFRLATVSDVTEEKQVKMEKLLPTVDVLQKAFGHPYVLTLNGKNAVRIQMDYIPTPVKLAPLDTILDVGICVLDIVRAEGIPAADSNGKSDAICRVKVNGALVYSTDKKRKTLEPEWNEQCELPLMLRSRDIVMVEIYDWDLTHDDRLLGAAQLDLSGLDPLTECPFLVKLNTQGEVFLRALFKPEYIRPSLGNKGGLPDLNDMHDALKAGAGSSVGAVANVGTTAGGAAYGVVLQFGSKGGELGRESKSFLRKFKGGRKLTDTRPDDSDIVSGLEADKKKADDGVGVTDAEKKLVSQQAGSLGKKISDNIDFGERPDEALPNMRPENLPPPQRPGAIGGHLRTPLDAALMSTFASLINGDQAIPGRVNVVSVAGFDGVLAIDVRVVLKTLTKEKELLKTRLYKSKDGIYKIGELSPFRLTSAGSLVFYVREHHSFGRSQVIATGELPLESVLNTNEQAVLKVDGGEIRVGIRYFSNHV